MGASVKKTSVCIRTRVKQKTLVFIIFLDSINSTGIPPLTMRSLILLSVVVVGIVAASDSVARSEKDCESGGHKCVAHGTNFNNAACRRPEGGYGCPGLGNACCKNNTPCEKEGHRCVVPRLKGHAAEVDSSCN